MLDHNEIMGMTHLCPVCGERRLKVKEMSWGNGTRVKMECPGCGAKGKLSNQPPWRGVELPEKTVREIFPEAGVIVQSLKRLENGYWGHLEDGAYPWWFVKTTIGWIEIGWRKRVISVDWEHTSVRKIVTSDDVTKGLTYVHAYSEAKAVEYLKELFNDKTKEN